MMSRPLTRVVRRLVVGVTLAALPSTSCRQAVESTTGPTEVTLSTAYFSGSLSPGGVRFYSFTVDEPGSVTALLASVTATSGAPLTIPLGLGFGIPRGTGCGLIRRIDATATLTSQLVQSATPGVYCIEVADVGQLTGPTNFALRFTYP